MKQIYWLYESKIFSYQKSPLRVQAMGSKGMISSITSMKISWRTSLPPKRRRTADLGQEQLILSCRDGTGFISVLNRKNLARGEPWSPNFVNLICGPENSLHFPQSDFLPMRWE